MSARIIQAAHPSLDIDPGRLRKARDLRCEHAGGGQYRVDSTENAYYVRRAPALVCACADWVLRLTPRGSVTPCKHILSAMLHEDADAVSQAQTAQTHSTSGDAAGLLLDRIGLLEDRVKRMPNGGPGALRHADLTVLSWIATHPATDGSVLEALATRVPHERAQMFLIAIPSAMKHRGVKTAIARQCASLSVAMRLMRHADATVFRKLLRGLIEAEAWNAILAVLEDSDLMARHRLHAEDLPALLTAPEPGLVARVILESSRAIPVQREKSSRIRR